MFVREHRGGAVGSVNMHPQIVSPADFCDYDQVVHNSRIRRAGRSHYAEGNSPCRAVQLNHLLQLHWIELQVAGHRYALQSLAPDAEQPSRFVERMMRFGRGIHHRQLADRCDAVLHRTGEVMRQRERHAAEVRFVTSAGERAAEFAVPTDALGNPAHSLEFDLRSELRPCQCRQLRIQGRYHRLRDESHVGRRRVHEAEVVRAGYMKSLGYHLAKDFLQHDERVCPVLRQRIVQGSIGSFLSRQLHRSVRQRRVVLINKLNETLADFTASVGIKIEAHRKLDENSEERMLTKRQGRRWVARAANARMPSLIAINAHGDPVQSLALVYAMKSARCVLEACCLYSSPRLVLADFIAFVTSNAICIACESDEE